LWIGPKYGKFTIVAKLDTPKPKPVHWIGSNHDELRKSPPSVARERFAKAVYVLHVFQKKSASGVKTPKHELDLIEARSKWAKADYEQLLKEIGNEDAAG
jgi:phage-related protein